MLVSSSSFFSSFADGSSPLISLSMYYIVMMPLLFLSLSLSLSLAFFVSYRQLPSTRTLSESREQLQPSYQNQRQIFYYFTENNIFHQIIIESISSSTLYAGMMESVVKLCTRQTHTMEMEHRQRSKTFGKNNGR